MSMRLGTPGLFALGGIVVPVVTGLLLFAAESYGSGVLEEAAFFVFAVSYPSAVLLWGVMADPTSPLLLVGLLFGSLLLNAWLYGIVGVLYARMQKRIAEEA